MVQKVQLILRYDLDLDREVKKRYPQMKRYHVLSKSLDARGAPKGRIPKFHYTLEIFFNEKKLTQLSELTKSKQVFTKRPIIIGAGPAGLFCALRLLARGIKCDLYERGDQAKTRMKKISQFWRYGKFDPDTNVCFGEGGAGLYSDGKLITRIKSEHIQYVMKEFVRFGAPEEIAFLSNPHLGSNKIRDIITLLSDFLKEQGCRIFYNQRVKKVLFQNTKATGVEFVGGRQVLSDHIVLATGHSAKEIYEGLYEEKVEMLPKDFAIGVRIEHERKLINQLQFGEFCAAEKLGTARYRLSYYSAESEKGTYSFCMCPGGYVLSSGSMASGIVTNGMSNSKQNSHWSNSALVVSVKASCDVKGDHPLKGLYYLEKIENKAYKASKLYGTGKELPAMTVGEFLEGKLTKEQLPKSSCPSKLVKVDIRTILPAFVCEHLSKALYEFDKKIPGFLHKKALLIAPETRTSSPITIKRCRETLVSTSHKGLYPTGEGAGYAGGITSAAVDGVKVAEAIAGF